MIDHIVEHRIAITHFLKDFFPFDVAKVVSSYIYHLQGISHTIGEHTDTVESITQLPDGRIVTGSRDATYRYSPISDHT